MPEDWIATISDTSQVVIARNRNPARFIGRELIAPLKQAVRAAEEGTGRYPVFDGPDAYSAWRRTPSLGWTVIVEQPEQGVVCLSDIDPRACITGGHIGQQLAMTPQTLRRRLHDEGQGFRAIKDDLRREDVFAETMIGSLGHGVIERKAGDMLDEFGARLRKAAEG